MIKLKSNSSNRIIDLNSDFVRDYYPDDVDYGNNILWSSARISEYLNENKEIFQIDHMIYNLDDSSLPELADLDYIIVINGGNNFSKNVKDKSGNFITVQNNQVLKYMGSNEYIQILNPAINKMQQIFNILNIQPSTYTGSSEFNLLTPSFYQFYQNKWIDIINEYLNKNKLIDKFSLGPFNTYDLIINPNTTEIIKIISDQNYNIKDVINNHYKQYSILIEYSCVNDFNIRIYDDQNIDNTYSVSQGNNMIFETSLIKDASDNIINTFSNLNIEIDTTENAIVHNLELLYYNLI